MTAARSRSVQAEKLAHEVREVARLHVRQLGWKRGLHLFAQRVGITERRAKALYTGEQTRVWADEWHAAMRADADLRRDRAVQLRAELHAIEAELNAGLVLAPLDAALGGGE